MGSTWIRPRFLFANIFSWAFIRMDPLNVLAKFEMSSFSCSWDNWGYPKKFGSPWMRPRVRPRVYDQDWGRSEAGFVIRPRSQTPRLPLERFLRQSSNNRRDNCYQYSTQQLIKPSLISCRQSSQLRRCLLQWMHQHQGYEMLHVEIKLVSN